jgi:purine-cytosine permease-like protein
LINTLIICVVRDSIFYDGMRAFMCMHVYVVYMYICIMCVCAYTSRIDLHSY